MTDHTDPRALRATAYDIGEAEDTAEHVHDSDVIFDVSEWLEPDGWDPDEELGDF